MKQNVNRMEIGSNFVTTGYELVAKAACDHGWVLVLSNNGSHLLVAEQELPNSGSTSDAKLTASYGYAGPASMSYHKALSLALGRMTETVLQHTAEVDFADEDACPGCGCKPGDGRTEGCDDPDGCGYWEALHAEELASALQACTGATSVTVRDGAATATVRTRCKNGGGLDCADNYCPGPHFA